MRGTSYASTLSTEPSGALVILRAGYTGTVDAVLALLTITVRKTDGTNASAAERRGALPVLRTEGASAHHTQIGKALIIVGASRTDAIHANVLSRTLDRIGATNSSSGALRCAGIIRKTVERSIVALLLRAHNTIAAIGTGNFLTQTSDGAAISIHKIPVITFLIRLKGAVSTDRL